MITTQSMSSMRHVVSRSLGARALDVDIKWFCQVDHVQEQGLHYPMEANAEYSPRKQEILMLKLLRTREASAEVVATILRVGIKSAASSGFDF